MFAGGRVGGNDGDWVCPAEGCGNINFARRMECNRCNTTRADAPKKPQFGEKKGLFGPGDWACGKCGNMNWERRNECNICKAPKASLGPDEKRDGAGGGFNERQERVASARREVDEDGYDDFGQRRQTQKLSQTDREAAALARLKASYSAMYDNEPSGAYSDDEDDRGRKPSAAAPTSRRSRSPERGGDRRRRSRTPPRKSRSRDRDRRDDRSSRGPSRRSRSRSRDRRR
ncbi:Aste57867_8223 [Aphanomyces stellatus]|uniref:Aste57867_8223 protein n=1 Tax=Aphanomyces stellatus TaxID=120398 RepID=A0A485KJQ9_9STRA|nr:hypothetical protein As57867_008192 [Aphanomyces stellatus]VFT85110.1 Aste57867_8223 [Aphanomyces stellatus]